VTAARELLAAAVRACPDPPTRAATALARAAEALGDPTLAATLATTPSAQPDRTQ
jgi:hypothetical protein